jgi:hypothetical protein
MGVITTADEKRDKAKEHVDLAYKYLLEALDPGTWGSDDFNKDYISTMEESLLKLIQIKRDL